MSRSPSRLPCTSVGRVNALCSSWRCLSALDLQTGMRGVPKNFCLVWLKKTMDLEGVSDTDSAPKKIQVVWVLVVAHQLGPFLPALFAPLHLDFTGKTLLVMM